MLTCEKISRPFLYEEATVQTQKPPSTYAPARDWAEPPLVRTVLVNQAGDKRHRSPTTRSDDDRLGAEREHLAPYILTTKRIGHMCAPLQEDIATRLMEIL